MYGYIGKLLFVDLSARTYETRPLDENIARNFLGGAGLGAKILYDEMPAKVDPFSADSILGFVSGTLNGTGAVMGGRYTVVSKSPVTGGWNDSNSGGFFGPMLRKSGYDAVFVRGVAEKPVYILIDDGNVEIRDASDLWGLTTKETEAAIKKIMGNKKFNAALIAPGGERMQLSAGIVNDSHRIAGRGGSGAVMGSKKLKALVVCGDQSVEVADKQKILSLNKSILDWQKNGPVKPVVTAFKRGGTSDDYAGHVISGDASVKNWTGAGLVDMTEEMITPLIPVNMDKRWFRKKYACYACPIGCGSIYQINEGDVNIDETGRPEYETAGMFGSQMLNSDPIILNQCNYLCNEYGLDTITVGGTIAWAMECFSIGILSKEELDGIDLYWGNAPAILEITEKICKGIGIGEILANGSVFAADYFAKGHECLVVAGKIEIPQHDPRYGPGLARTYKYDPTPGRHVKGGLGGNCGNQPPEVKFNYDGLAEGDVAGVVLYEIMNSAGLCMFTEFGLPPGADIALINAATGFNYNDEERTILGKRLFAIRHAFNLREGFRRKDATISDRIIGKPPLKHGPLEGVTVDVERMGDNFFRLMGYEQDSMPKKETLEQLGNLENVIRDLYQELTGSKKDLE
jgi:aldehyde:ferredoxin oxidoreductase